MLEYLFHSTVSFVKTGFTIFGEIFTSIGDIVSEILFYLNLWFW